MVETEGGVRPRTRASRTPERTLAERSGTARHAAKGIPSGPKTLLGPGGAKLYYARTPNAAGSKSRPVESRTTGSNPDTGFSCKHGIGTRPLRPGLTERTRGISYPETALGRKEPRDPLPLGGQCRWSDSPICAVRSCAGAMLLTLDRICANR